MERFLSAGPAESGAVFYRPYNNKLSIDKGCICGERKDLESKL